MPRSAIVLTIGAAVAATAVVAGAVTASASPGESGNEKGRENAVTLRFDVETSPFSYTDLGDPGPSAADVIVFHDQLFQDGRQVGHEVGSCTVVESSGLSNCTGVVTLDGQGTITFAFENAPPPEKILAITGGTGKYRTAHGEGVFVESGEGTAVLTLKVIRD